MHKIIHLKKNQKPRTQAEQKVMEVALDNNGQIPEHEANEISEDVKFAIFMYETLSFAALQWLEKYDTSFLPAESKYKTKNMKDAIGYYHLKSNAAQPERKPIYERMAKDFLSIMDLIREQKLSNDKHQLLSFVTQLASGNESELKALYLKIGVFISKYSILRRDAS